MPPEPIHGSAHPIGAVLERALMRLRARDVLRATAVAAIVAGATCAALTMSGVQVAWRIGIPALVLAATAWLVLNRSRRDRTARGAATAIERADPSLRNLVFTAAQLLESAEGIRPYMRERVFREAFTRASSVDLRRAVPLSRDVLVLTVAVATAGLLTLVRVPAASRAPSSGQAAAAATARANVSDS